MGILKVSKSQNQFAQKTNEIFDKILPQLHSFVFWAMEFQEKMLLRFTKLQYSHRNSSLLFLLFDLSLESSNKTLKTFIRTKETVNFSVGSKKHCHLGEDQRPPTFDLLTLVFAARLLKSPYPDRKIWECVRKSFACQLK